MSVRRKYLDYKDTFITIFNDDDKCFLVFITDTGKSKVISYDDNFFYVEYLLDIYLEMIEASFKGWKHKRLTQNDYEEIKACLGKYYKHLKRQCEIDLECVSNETRGVLSV